MMRRVLTFLTVGAILVLAPSVALASTPVVDGSVTQKFIATNDEDDGTRVIAVDGALYQVPLAVYLTVNVGDIVHFDGENWVVMGK